MGQVMNFLLFATLSTLIGLSTAWHMVENGNEFTTLKVGPWISWTTAGNPQADPYTRAHFARSGQLPMSSTTARYFEATTDDKGRALRANCEYKVSGTPIDAMWWSIAAYNDKGLVFKSKSGRHAFNSRNVFLRNDGTFHIRTAPRARPGNWLPTTGSRRFRLSLRIYRPRQQSDFDDATKAKELLPTVTRVECL